MLIKLTRENACGKLPASRFWRMAHHATVLTTKGKSYRMRKRRMREEPS